MRKADETCLGKQMGSDVHVWTYCLGRVHTRIVDGDDVDVRRVVAKM